MDKIIKIILIILVLILFFKNYKENFSANGCKDEDDSYCGDENYCAKDGNCYSKLYCNKENRKIYWPTYDYIRHHKCRDAVCTELNDDCEYDEMFYSEGDEPIPNNKFKELVYKYMKAILEPLYPDYWQNETTTPKLPEWPISNFVSKWYLFTHGELEMYLIDFLLYEDTIQLQSRIDKNHKQLMIDNKTYKDIVNKYGKIENWNVSKVEDMSDAFAFAGGNGTDWIPRVGGIGGAWGYYMLPKMDLSNWDVSNVKNMSHMFDLNKTGLKFPKKYNIIDLNISSWDVSNVEDMSYMFNSCTFKSDISSWVVSNVTNMSHMFSTSYFFHHLGGWKHHIPYNHKKNKRISNLMLEKYKLNLSTWNVSNVTNMSHMFKYHTFHMHDTPPPKPFTFKGISKWNVSNVKDMSHMFEYRGFNEDISNWNVSNVEDMTQMFYAKYYYFSFKYSYFSFKYSADIDILDEKEEIDKKWEVYKDLSKTKMSDYEIFEKIGMYFPVHFNKDLSKWKWPKGKVPKHKNFAFSVDNPPKWVLLGERPKDNNKYYTKEQQSRLNVDKKGVKITKQQEQQEKQVTLFTKDRYPPQFLDNQLGYEPSRFLKPDIKFKVKPFYNKETQKLTFTIWNDSMTYTLGLLRTKEKDDFRKNEHIIMFRNRNDDYKSVNFNISQFDNNLKNQVYFSKDGYVTNRHLGPNGKQEFELPVGPLKPGTYAIFLDVNNIDNEKNEGGEGGEAYYGTFPRTQEHWKSWQGTNNYAEFIVPN